MKHYLLLFFLGFTFFCNTQNLPQPTSLSQSNLFDEKISVVQVFIESNEELNELISLNIGVDHIHYDENGAIELYLSSSNLKELRSAEIAYEIKIDDFDLFFEDRAKREAPYIDSFEKMTRTATNFGFGSMGGFYTYEEVVQALDEMNTLFPHIVKAKFSIGQTHENRNIWAIKISDNPDIDESEPAVYYDALHHAREPLSMAVTINYMYWLLENYDSNPLVEYIVNNRELYFIPIVNPDGYVYNEITNPNGGGLWRKNRRDNGDATYGVDLNRNYSHAYNHNSNCSSQNSISNTYSGPHSFSEPETQAIRDFIEDINPAIAFSSHSTAGKFLMPYGFDTSPPDFSTYSSWASDFLSDNDYPYGVAHQMLGYTSCGTARDYLHHRGIYGWTPEIGGSGFWPSQSEIFHLVDENVEPLFYQAKIAGSMVDFQSFTRHNDAIVGDSLTLAIELINKGIGSIATDIEVSLLPKNSQVTVSASQTYPNIETQKKVDNSSDPFKIYIHENYTEGILELDVLITQNGIESTKETITIYIGSRTSLFKDDAEQGALNWATSGLGIPWSTVQDDCYKGDYAFGDSNGGNCENNTSNYFTCLSEIDLSNSLKPLLSFCSKWSLDKNDYVELQISKDNGETYDGLKKFTLNNKWTQQQIDLLDFKGHKIKLRFHLFSNEHTNADGFYFDDFIIDDLDCSDCPLCDISISDFPDQESFENETIEWKQITDGSDELDWIRHSGSTPSSATGPSVAADSFFYMYIESSDTNNASKKAILESSCYDFRKSLSAVLEFQYHMFGSTEMKLKIEISLDKGNSWKDIGFKIEGDQGNIWNSQSIDLSEYLGEMAIFRIIATTGNSWQSDIAIDDIIVLSEQTNCIVGSSCVDGDSCTVGESYDVNCNCTGGTITDSDNDGICDYIDVCPDLDDTLIGYGCDDNNECTIEDIYTSNCLCEGILIDDSDSDGVCDTEDLCPGLDDNIIGEPCDDGDQCTENEFFDSDCNCSGGSLVDNDSDDICDYLDPCPTDNYNICQLPEYCISRGISTTYEHIEQVILNDLNYISGNNRGYKDNEDKAAHLHSGQNYYMILVPGYNSSEYTENWRVWIDFNRDGDFEGPSELVLSSSGTNIISETIYIPSGLQLNGGTKMRVAMKYDGIPTSCESFSWGEVEDYIVLIAPECISGDDCNDNNECTIGEIYDDNCNCSGGVTIDLDGDGYCNFEDPDDTDPCIPMEASCYSCEDISIDNFENGFGSWNDGGSDCYWYSGYANSGSYSIRLRDNSGMGSSLYSTLISLKDYSSIAISFSYLPQRMEPGERFILEYSLDQGSSFIATKYWSSNLDFENGIRYFENETITDLGTNENIIIRLRCDASANSDEIYIDDIHIEGCRLTDDIKNEKEIEKRYSEEKSLQLNAMSIYPNPASNKLFIKSNGAFKKDEKLFFTIYGIDGSALINQQVEARNNLEVDLKELKKSSYYFLKIMRFSGETYTHRFIKID